MDIQFRAQGGSPISPELAIDLRKFIFGTAAVPVRCEWAVTALNFAPPKEEQAYGLISPRNATRGMLSVLQGFILKHLLFKRSLSRSAGGPSAADLLRPNEEQQIEALISSMVEILTQISEKGKFIVTLPGEDSFIAHSITYFQDTITEKLYIFQLESKGALETFYKRNIHFFTAEDSPGALLFLYSAVLTRSIAKTRSDMDNKSSGVVSLVGNKEEGSLNIVTLLLTGRATPYIHNGVVHAGDENNYAAPQYGTLNRCSIGLLIWENENKQTSTMPGSRLKTPHLPIWITSCIGHFGVVFNNNQDLLRNYHAESRFDLVYYSCSGNEVSMTIDNRGLNEFSATMENQQMESTSSLSGPVPTEGKEESINNTPLQHLIHTKWGDACITFHCQNSVVRYLFTN